jgi:hypothetical protein
MTPRRPIIAAIDPHRDDRSPAMLGLLLAELAGAPLVLASAYTVDPWADPLLPVDDREPREATKRALDLCASGPRRMQTRR